MSPPDPFPRSGGEAAIRVATDIGGTFTDLVALGEAGDVMVSKAASTPPTFAQGVYDVIDRSGIDPAAVRGFVHGSTVVINALTERKGARTALVTTRGFRDVLGVGRATRPAMYDLRFRKQSAFVPRSLRYEVDERLDFRGNVVRPLALDSVDEVAAAVRDAGVEAIGVCLLHAYANPAHERATAERLREALPGVAVSTSSEISQEWREYERSNTVALNAYVQPVASRYLGDLASGLRERGTDGDLLVMKSGGGSATFDFAARQPIHLVESGPVGGVIGARAVGEAIGMRDLITLDVGGTTAKTALIDDGTIAYTTDYKIERDDRRPGYPIKVPVVDIVEIGAGGGSIARHDPVSGLAIGPDSAGAVPGPACYGRGGSEPTVTDANLVLGRIDPGYFLGGEMSVDLDAARRSFQPLADTFGVSVEEAAEGVLRLADANMVGAVKLVSIRRGYDPRDFALMAFGGGGGLHAAAIAAELQIARVVVPPWPGTFSALGMLIAEPRHDAVRTRVTAFGPDTAEDVDRLFAELEDEARAVLRDTGLGEDGVQVDRRVDLRYVGQEHTVGVPFEQGGTPALREAFEHAHQAKYTFRLDSEIEYVNFHLSVRKARPPFELRGPTASDPTASDPRAGEPRTRSVWFDGGWTDAAVLHRDGMPPGRRWQGPAIVEESSSTTVVPPGATVHADDRGDLILETGGRSA